MQIWLFSRQIQVVVIPAVQVVVIPVVPVIHVLPKDTLKFLKKAFYNFL